MTRPASSIPPFIAGLCSIPCIVLQPRLTMLAFQMLFCFCCALAHRKKIKPLYFIFLIASVSFFHLLTPRGDVYFYIWRVPITAGALLTGVQKGMLVSTLVFCSLATVRSGIRLPTAFGRLLSSVFAHFDILFQQRHQLRRKSLLQDIDQLLSRMLVSTQSSPNQTHTDRAAWMKETAFALLFFATHLASVIIARQEYYPFL